MRAVNERERLLAPRPHPDAPEDGRGHHGVDGSRIDEELLLDRQSTVARIAQADLEGREAHRGHSCRAWRSGASEAHCLDPEHGCPALHPSPKVPAVPIDIGVYLPQVGFSWDELRARVVFCDRLGIPSVWFMDHLYPPGLPTVPSFEAWTTAAALAGVTERVRLGHLVLANGFPHPPLLAKMAVTLDYASGGRLELGPGSGSPAPAGARVRPAFPEAAQRAR